MISFSHIKSFLVSKIVLMNTDNNSIRLLGSTLIPPCPGSFSCDNRTCVNISQVCNGVPDCPRGDDELVCGEFSDNRGKKKVGMTVWMDGVRIRSNWLKKILQNVERMGIKKEVGIERRLRGWKAGVHRERGEEIRKGNLKAD